MPAGDSGPSNAGRYRNHDAIEFSLTFISQGPNKKDDKKASTFDTSAQPAPDCTSIRHVLKDTVDLRCPNSQAPIPTQSYP